MQDGSFRLLWLIALLLPWSMGAAQCESDAAGNTYSGQPDAGRECPAFTGAVPERCTGVSAPVCGCNGNTYDTPCHAAAAQVGIRRAGACPSVFSCTYEGGQHAPGSSYPAADGCNTCTCQSDGRSVCTDAACPARKACNGQANDCPSGFFCKLALGASCDARGECMPKPTPSEPCATGGGLVCGCDGETYESACAAAEAGTSVLHPSFCGGCDYAGMTHAGGTTFDSDDGCNTCTCDGATGEVTCGADTCPEQSCGVCLGYAQYCDYDEAAACGDNGAQSICKPRSQPADCDAADEPVCGCDGVTYTNACQAHSWSIGVRSQGPCPIPDGCERDGKHYYIGEQFPAADSCNTCTCYADGIASCTAIGCL